VPYLIDGYNLLFAYLGAPPSRKLPRALERGRRRLLELMRFGHEGAVVDVSVIFDAPHAPGNARAESDYHGIHVTFAVHDERADDLIEKMIRRASAPRQLIVVSDDRHIQQAARRRHCIVRGCADYLEALEQRKLGAKPHTAEDPPGVRKPHTVSTEEAQSWLAEFADLEHDRALQELTDPYGFAKDESFPEK
jgi:predicted RNA-binding protein with PIN domain